MALDRLKTFLSSAPVLVALNPCEPLLLYQAATNHVVSAALVVEREEPGHALKVQCPVYFVSEVLTDTKSRYPQTQKLLYAVVMMAKKLHVTPQPKGLIGLIEYSYQQVATSFPEDGLQTTPRLSVLGPEKFGDG